MVHNALMKDPGLPMIDKIMLKLGKVKQLLKPLTPKGIAEEKNITQLINEAKVGRSKGAAVRPGEPAWVMHYPGTTSQGPEWVDLKSGEVVREEPALHADQEADENALAAEENLCIELESEVEVVADSAADVFEVDSETLTVRENEFFQDDTQMLFGSLDKFRKIVHRVYHANGVQGDVQAAYNRKIVEILRGAEDQVRACFTEQHCDSSALSTEANIYSVLAKRKALAYYREHVYMDALASDKEVPSPGELKAAWEALPQEEKKKFEDLEVQDEKRYILERHVYNLSAIKPVFESGDKGAARTAGEYLRVEVIAGCGAVRKVKDKNENVHQDVEVADLLLEPNKEVAGTWLKDVCIGDKVYAIKTAADDAYSFGIVRAEAGEAGDKTYAVEFDGSKLEVPIFHILLKAKTKPISRAETER